jgi:hypothetical protein
MKEHVQRCRTSFTLGSGHDLDSSGNCMTWPRILGPMPTLKDINLLCWLLLGTFSIPLLLAQRPSEGKNTDFVQLYSVGRILQEYPADELYDYRLQQKLFRELNPLQEGSYGPSPYPPFVAVLFRQMARLPYFPAYLLWISISLLLYLLGLTVMTGMFLDGDPVHRSLVFCVALGFHPFIIGTMINGQLSAVGFLSLALTIREERRSRSFLSGLALSLCAYKPTLLVLILPMLLVTRRLRALAGFTTGVLALILFATAIEGARVWSGYFDLLRYFSGLHPWLRLRMYIDFRAFASLLSRTHSWIAFIVVGSHASWAAVRLVRMWLRSVGAGSSAGAAVWGTTITLTLLLNVYVPIYDSILLVLSTIMTGHLTKKFAGRWFEALCLLVFVSSWFTVQLAARTGIQLVTIFVAALSVIQMKASEIAIGPKFAMQAQAQPARNKEI